MKLTLEQIRSITLGAVRITEDNGAVQFYRFSEEQERLYKLHSLSLYPKTFSTAGIRMEFTTDSTKLGLSATVVAGSSRTFFHFEILANGKKIGELGSKTENCGDFSGEFDLGAGEKTVRIYFPWSVNAMLKAMTLDDGASLSPIKKARKMLIFGDSITHGYDAVYPSHTYATKLTDALDAEAVNQAIGGERFWSELAESCDVSDPELITVAYGTNDWNGAERDVFERECSSFYRTLSQKYPAAKIFAITPIWRADLDRMTKVGAFEEAAAYIRKVVADLPNVTVIEGFDFVPHDTELFSDKFLHPNDEGFAFYFNNLYRELQKYL